MNDQLFSDWMEGYNSISNYLDETEFQVDLYEAESYYLAESLLRCANEKDIQLDVKDNYLTITISKSDEDIKSRTVYFPQLIEKKTITSSFANGILEVKIFKD